MSFSSFYLIRELQIVVVVTFSCELYREIIEESTYTTNRAVVVMCVLLISVTKNLIYTPV